MLSQLSWEKWFSSDPGVQGSRAMGKIYATLFLMMAALESACAQEVPRYDPDGWCKRVGEFGGGASELIRRGCFEQEQTAYDKLKTMRGSVPLKTQRWCDQVAKSGGRGSYVILEQCVDMEHTSKIKNDSSKFRF